ncbi:MAG: T9SS type A sorting domain-containing protein [Bacteroidetes bacterium]|nr:T9SS type A sorting domain-containing protein [Bacteroidota bacterium]
MKKLTAGLLLLALAISSSVAGVKPDTKTTKGIKKQSAFVDFNYLDINNILIYFENTGNIQDPSGNWSIEYPKGSGKHPIFAAGFTFSGYIDGDLSTAWMASASRIEEWQPGNIVNGVPADPNNPRFKVYKYTRGDSPSANTDIINWPADMGAPFVTKDGVEYPNGNTPTKTYDPANGDLPLLRGDQMLWYVINDGIIPANRLRGSKQFGLEAQVNAFSFAVQNELGNVAYVIYKFINKGSFPIERAIFSVWSDPDLGDSEDDLVGVDTTRIDRKGLPNNLTGIPRSLAYCYNASNNDATYGAAPPASGYDFFLGPQIETGVSTDTAFVLGRPKVGFKELVMDSFVKYVRGDPTLPDPGTIDEARYYQEGYKFNGAPFNPLSEGAGGTATDNPRIVHPGYPELGTGWRDVNGGDKRMMINTKQFTIAPGDTQIVVVGYMVGQGSDNFNSVAKLRVVDDFAQKVFNANFKVAGPPPAPKEGLIRTDDKGGLNITFKSKESFTDVQKDDLNNKKLFKGYNIYQYLTNSTADEIDGVANKKLLASISRADGYNMVYKKSADGLTQNLVYETKTTFDNDSDYSNDESYFTYNVPVDAFTNFPFIDGEDYFFGVSSFNIEVNYMDTLLNKDGLVIGYSGPDPISESIASFIPITYRSTVREPYIIGASQSAASYGGKYVKKTQGSGDGPVVVDVVNQNAVVDGAAYEVEFFYPNKTDLAYRIKRKADTVAPANLDTLLQYSTNLINPVIDGLSIRVGEATASVTQVDNSGATWVGKSAIRTKNGADHTTLSSKNVSGGFIKDDPLTAGLDKQVLSPAKSSMVREIEIEFNKAAPSKAYRYISGVRPPVGSFARPYMPKHVASNFSTTTDSIVWGGYLAQNTTDLPSAGRIRATRKPGVGVIDLPIIAWDKSYGQNRRLKVALVESFIPVPGNPATSNLHVNGRWNGTASARETILISGEDYDPNLIDVKDSTLLDPYMFTLVQKGEFKNPWILAWEPVGDTLQMVDGQKITLKTSAWTSGDEFEISGFTSADKYYAENRGNAFDKLTIYPNPYMGDNPQEISANSRFVTLLGMPKVATVRIYNLAGELVRKIEKDDPFAMLRWDLKNTTGLNVASGVYLINIDAPGVGNKTLKFALVQRQERIEIF